VFSGTLNPTHLLTFTAVVILLGGRMGA